MLSKRVLSLLTLALLGSLLVAGTALADDGRINRPPYHFGGDTLYCVQNGGCTLVNLNGQELAAWPQTALADAFAAFDLAKVNTPVEGNALGSYGPVQLWVVGADESGAHSLCMVGYDEWGKQNQMCFTAYGDYTYDQAPLPLPTEPLPVGGCSVDLGTLGFTSVDGIHTGVGYDVWDAYPGTFLYWTATNPGLPACLLLA